jgi:hypothetical protein
MFIAGIIIIDFKRLLTVRRFKTHVEAIDLPIDQRF